MEIKRPSIKGMKNMGHLGHFTKDKFIQQGHNDVYTDKQEKLELVKEQSEVNKPSQEVTQGALDLEKKAANREGERQDIKDSMKQSWSK